ncbi:carbohydrate sulfotransferase 10-like [Penaeus chinensis]|uniref:carbohydrate sulfotransferase 10-like n=1 Tax=Penaeus chinensis TaxID=139456 RepID=UPI001FB6B291|nr:carbohydrate sulfotransferase 10-like [Penaeus chinensis]XP_047501369.1 carbohydrate sulfotransferase 10-like [Penaeus chinensis]
MKQIFSRKSLLLDVVVIASFLYFTASGLYGGPAAGEVAVQGARNAAIGDGDLPRSTKKGKNNENLNARGTRKKERKKEELERQRNNRATLPAIKPSGGDALRGIDLAEYTPEERAVLGARMSEMEARASTVSRVCQATPSISGATAIDLFIWDTDHTPNIVWCPIYKVASTTWMNNFFSVANLSKSDESVLERFNQKLEWKKRKGNDIKQFFDHKLVYDLYPGPQSPEERARVLKNSARVIIVRHPFSRILSVYRDKMTNRNPRPVRFNFKKLQVYIRKTYRSRHSSNRSRFPSFPEFIQYVIDSTGNFTSYEDWKENVNCWLPYWVRCTVCSVDFNIIIKLETMEEDKRFLATLSRLNELKDKDTWMHLRTAPSSDLGAKYYKQLTRHQILQLYERYEPDFKLFQYDIKDYLDNAIDSTKRSANS